MIFEIKISTPGRGFVDVSGELQSVVLQSKAQTGLCHVFLRHTSASLLITENADPDVRRDLEHFISRLAPDGDPAWLHRMEGPDDMPAHIRSALTSSELTLPIRDGQLALGTWQGVYLWEHRTRPHRRRMDVTIIA
ncbi:MAG: YjbQ family protein [Xanthomonadales bacterium]|nr:secondary thiamine-phosphate synthase enzyme YjbQ [Gammaproteobacteria bacterium]MBT8055129.1 secondary thiamine-phosphate synthase enzyme YjbQ [Gammaproteobacteria bacterium]NND58382.1 YjbQ family protein [Xanthomonadales bacterium]NNK51723.1 YjbQ family protein [Xanthomonadales bacterium]